jgi:hypothetical protein
VVGVAAVLIHIHIIPPRGIWKDVRPSAPHGAAVTSELRAQRRLEHLASGIPGQFTNELDAGGALGLRHALTRVGDQFVAADVES